MWMDQSMVCKLIVTHMLQVKENLDVDSNVYKPFITVCPENTLISLNVKSANETIPSA